jgi:hypothetical protein
VVGGPCVVEPGSTSLALSKAFAWGERPGVSGDEPWVSQMGQSVNRNQSNALRTLRFVSISLAKWIAFD